ncbi:MAG: hypothetical protein F6K09_12410 [Merismopedia sp. SIO2A8]|nr:hypothetical protein [Symploca sp. SIO2B6]NET49497.1 hypothetical protein [Merismopedia sp. SIO2A8]
MKRPNPDSIDRALYTAIQNGTACLDWRILSELGLSETDAKEMVKALALRQGMKHYREQLLKVGVVASEALKVAEAIARYDTFGDLPTTTQQMLIHRYCVEICRARLWRSDLLGSLAR